MADAPKPPRKKHRAAAPESEQPYSLAKDLGEKALGVAKKNPIATGVGAAAVVVVGTGLVTATVLGVGVQALVRNRNNIPTSTDEAAEKLDTLAGKAKGLFARLAGGTAEQEPESPVPAAKEPEITPARKPRRKPTPGNDVAP